MLDYEIKKTYEDMELYLINSMKRNLTRHLREEDKLGFKYPQWQAEKLKEIKRYQRENKDIIRTYVKGLDKDISAYLKEELKQGSLSTLKKYKEVMGDKYKANKSVNKSFFRTNDRKVTALINSVNNDLKKGNSAVLRLTNDQYRQAIFKSQLYVSNGVLTPKQAQAIAVSDIKKAKELEEYKLTTLGVDKANKDFLRGGLNSIVYKDGKRVNIASYVQMAIRTAGQRAHLMGEGKFRKGYGYHLVKVTTHGTSCKLCQGWQGQILIDDVYGGGSKKDGKYPLLSDAMKQGFLHPNCKHGLTTYFPEIDDIEQSFADGKDGAESDAAYEQDMNYINRKIKEYTRLEQGSIDPENVTTYKDKRKEWENKKLALTRKTTIGQKVMNVAQVPITYTTLNDKGISTLQAQSDSVYNDIPSTYKKILNDYTTGGYENVNEFLNGAFMPEGNNKIFINREIEILDETMSKFELKENITTFRGTNKKHYDKYNVGDTFTEKVYYSTSVKENNAKEFLSKHKGTDANGDLYDNSMLVEVRVPKGTKSLYVGKNGDYKQEYELLLSRGLKYKVIEKKEHNIILEIIKRR